MSEATVEATCGNCGRTLAEDPGIPYEQRKPCPACGSLTRLHKASVSTTLTLRAQVSAEVSRLRETYEHDPRWQAVGVALVVVPSVLGYWLSGWVGVLVGLAFGIVGLWVGPKGTRIVREIDRSSG